MFGFPCLQYYTNINYSTNLVTIHRIQNQKLNYHADHYTEISALTFNKNSYEMIEIARNNLKMIGELYQNE